MDRFEERWEIKEHANEISQLEEEHEKELGEYQDELEIAQCFINEIFQHEDYMEYRQNWIDEQKRHEEKMKLKIKELNKE